MIIIDVSQINKMVIDDEVDEMFADEVEEMATDIFVELTSPPPGGTPVDTGAARQGWQLDMSDPMAPEIYNTVPYINRLNDGSSTQSPAGFIEAAIDKHTRD